MFDLCTMSSSQRVNTVRGGHVFIAGFVPGGLLCQPPSSHWRWGHVRPSSCNVPLGMFRVFAEEVKARQAQASVHGSGSERKAQPNTAACSVGSSREVSAQSRPVTPSVSARRDVCFQTQPASSRLPGQLCTVRAKAIHRGGTGSSPLLAGGHAAVAHRGVCVGVT